MTTATALTLLGFGLGALMIARSSSTQRDGSSLRDRAIAAQRDAARAAERARELAEIASREGR